MYSSSNRAAPDKCYVSIGARSHFPTPRPPPSALKLATYQPPVARVVSAHLHLEVVRLLRQGQVVDLRLQVRHLKAASESSAGDPKRSKPIEQESRRVVQDLRVYGSRASALVPGEEPAYEIKTA